MSKHNDIYYMQKALTLATRGIYTSSANPNVGCLIVKKGNIVGEGYHYKVGQPHAEVHALNMAGEQACGATAYVTLEPCVHTGRTSPCADALIKAGVARVVIAILDPNPLVAGKGAKKLQSAGITVTLGVLVTQAEALNVDFFKRMQRKMPYIRLKMASSLDGKTAMASGESQWITSAASRQDVQQFRAKSCAILSTSSTVLVDDPSLTVRWQELPYNVKKHYLPQAIRSPVRIILDSQNKLSFNEKLFLLPGEIWLVTKRPYKHNKVPDNVKVLIDHSTLKQIDLHWLFKILAEEEMNSIWIEAGARLAGALIESKLIDELILYMAPLLLGNDAIDLCVLSGVTQLSAAPAFRLKNIKQLGNDLRLMFTPKTD